MKKASANEFKNPLKHYKPIGFSCLIGALVIFVVLVLSAFLITIRDFPQRTLWVFLMAAVILGALTAGYCCARILRSQGMIFGFICGVLLFAVTFLGKLTLFGPQLDLPVLYKFIAFTVSGMIGGIFGVNKRRSVRRK